MKEHDIVILRSDLPEDGLKAGDVGTIVHIHNEGEAYEVEFISVDGSVSVIATALASQVRPATQRDMAHARPMEAAA